MAAEGLTQADAISVTCDGNRPPKQSYSGEAYIDRAPGLQDVNDPDDTPYEGATIYLQWMNGKGFISPYYKTTSDANGKFCFDLSKPVTDALGNSYEFKLAGDADFLVRTWLENPDPDNLVMARFGDAFPGTFHDRVTRINESWDFTVGINRIVNGKAAFQEKPNKDGWLAKPEADWVEVPGGEKWVSQGNYGTLRGTRWNDSTANGGTLANQYYKEKGDVWATGTKVVASYVNDEVANLFDQWKKR